MPRVSWTQSLGFTPWRSTRRSNDFGAYEGCGLQPGTTGYAPASPYEKEKIMTTADNDVITVVLGQHQDVAGRLDAVMSAAGSTRADAFEALADLLDVHETAEETVIYPALRKLGNEAARVADDRAHEEAAAKQILTRLKGLDAGSNEFESLFSEFSAKVHEHAASEESEVIPLLTSSLSAQERQAMGDAFRASQKATSGR
jgi:hemerythrin-like domain-containing protein